MSSTSDSNLPSFRRIVTGHTPEGKSVVAEDAPARPYPFGGTKTLFYDVFWTDQSPPLNDVVFRDLAKEHPSELHPSEGSSFKVTDFPPGQKSPFHRTVTFDYIVLTHGQLTLILDDDKRVNLRPGDVVIQRGTIHAWHNEGAEWARMYTVMLPSQRVKIGENEFGEEFRAPPGQPQASQK